MPPGPASLCQYSWFSETRNKEASFCFLACYHFLCLFGWTTEQKHQMWPEECQQSLAARMWANLEAACVLSKANFRLKLRFLHEHQFQHFTPKNTFYCPQISSCPTFHHTQLQKSHLTGVSNLNMMLPNSYWKTVKDNQCFPQDYPTFEERNGMVRNSSITHHPNCAYLEVESVGAKESLLWKQALCWRERQKRAREQSRAHLKAETIQWWTECPHWLVDSTRAECRERDPCSLFTGHTWEEVNRHVERW